MKDHICEQCKKPVYEGHIDCTCEKSHPDSTVDCTLCTRCKKNEAIAKGDSGDAKWYGGRYCAPCLGEIKAIQAQRREYDERWRRRQIREGRNPDIFVKDAEREAMGEFKEDIYDWGNDWDRR